tara:strand:+ start:277 stop:558 length:282 start_codon:yes stop_codon:yes gene_type:complete
MDEIIKDEMLEKLMDAVTTTMAHLGVSSLLLTPDSNHDGNSFYEELRDEFCVILEKQMYGRTKLELEFRDKLIELGEDEFIKYYEKQFAKGQE